MSCSLDILAEILDTSRPGDRNHPLILVQLPHKSELGSGEADLLGKVFDTGDKVEILVEVCLGEAVEAKADVALG